ncbi:hypothetical protein QJQ45_002108 [Haematococcus lacustris]|nr:hypothetical protein QJQ45_002108 [Haematococcus lacustris]
MDLVVKLPVGVHGYDSICVVVDRLSKMVHLIPCIEAMDAKEFAELYIDHVFKYHGLSKVTISDRGATFNNQFWIEVRKLIGVDPAFSTAYHPESNGQTERTNQIVEEMLRHYILPTQVDWPRHLAFAEFAINNSWQESIQSTPFLVNYGQSPITPMLHKLPRPCLSPSAESFAKKWEHEVKHAQECMRVAQDRQERYENKRRRDVTFSVGDSVLLSTKNLRNAPGKARKFLPRYVGPFKVTGRLGESAYRLELPPTMSRLHPVFHVSLLKKYTGSQGFHPPPVLEWLEDAPHYEVHSLLNHRQVRFKKRMEYLVKWTGYDDTYNTLEPEANLAGQAADPADEGPGTWPKEEWLLGPWAHLQLDPQVWGMGTTTLLDFSVKLARVRLHQLQRVSADPLYPPGGGLWPALWGVRPPRAAGEPEVAAVADGALRELELKWEASVQQVAGQGAAGEREQQGRDVEERLPEEVQGSQPPRWLDTSARGHQRPSPQMRAAQQAERQLEVQQRRGGRHPFAQPAPWADTVDQLAVGVQAGQPCAKVWKELLDPTLRREHVIVAWRVLHASLMVGALWGHILKGTAAPGSSACRFCQPGHLETLTHAFLTCPAVVPAWEWVLDVYGRLTGTRPPSGDAMLLLMWRLRSSGATTALQPQQVARRVVEEVISTLTTAVKRDWHRVGRNIRVGLCGAVPSTWFKGKDPELDAAHFDQLWPEASGGWFAKQPRRERRGGQEGAEGRPLWYNAQVRMNPAPREAAAEQGWTHVRHVREALHSPQLEEEARWVADLVRACLPEPWQGMVDRVQPPQPEWECLRVAPGVEFGMRRTPMLQPSHWVGPNGRLYPLDPTGQGPLGDFWAEEGAAWEPAAVARLNKPSYRLTPEERATHLRPLPAQRHVAQ